MESGRQKQDIRLLVVSNLTKFSESKRKDYTAGILKEYFARSVRNRIALVCTGDANVTSRGVIPRPIGGTYLKHVINVIVYFAESSYPQAYKAPLVKHQYSKTPKSVIINTRKAGRMLLSDGS
jgi:hypothetical protein